jgi:CRISPR-associated endonuclease Csn1
LRDDLDTKLRAMTVSHRPDHGAATRGSRDSTTGALHEDTAYGVMRNSDKENGANLVYRKSFRDLNDKEITRIRDRRLRDLLTDHVEKEKLAGKDLKAALLSFTERTDMPGIQQPIRHVRLTKSEKPEYLVTVRDEAGNAYKAYSAGENAFVDIFETRDGKWSGEASSVFKANQPEASPAWRTNQGDARFIMRIHKGDLISVDLEGKRTVMVVHRLDASANRFKLAAHNETGNLDQRHADQADPFRWLMASYNTLKAMKAERVRVDELGRPWRIAPDEGARSLR